MNGLASAIALEALYQVAQELSGGAWGRGPWLVDQRKYFAQLHAFHPMVAEALEPGHAAARVFEAWTLQLSEAIGRFGGEIMRENAGRFPRRRRFGRRELAS